MTFSDETLMAYVDNELDPQMRAAVEAAMATDPEIARKVARHQALRGRLATEFNAALEEPPPQRLIDAARGVPQIRREGNVIPLRRKTTQRRGWPQWASLAATLVVGVLIGQVLMRASNKDSPVDGRFVARGVLETALSAQLASVQTDTSPVRIGTTFKSKSGTYCRTFTLHQSTDLAGVACRDHDNWHVRVLAQAAQPAQTPNSTTYRQAATDLPQSVMQTVTDTIAGEPLDAHAENTARDQNWTP